MIATIEAVPPNRYGPRMRSVLLRLVAIFAVLIAPVGMTAAPAMAQHQHTASMPMQHCPDQNPAQSGKVGFAECTMACSAALPAVEPGQAGLLPMPGAPVEANPVAQLHGLHPDTATPPPRLS